MKIGVVIPWRETPSRIKPFEYTVNWYKETLPDAEIFFCDRPGSTWMAAASRNDGVRKAQDAHCDVIVMGDADTIPEKQTLLRAISAAQNDMLIHSPFTICRYLDMDATNAVLEDNVDIYSIPSREGIWEINWAAGGIFVFQPEAWWRLGGMDEKIVHGPEDLCFQRVHEVVNGTNFIRHAGTITCFAHVKIEKENKSDWDREHNNINWYHKYMSTTNPGVILEMVESKYMRF